MTGKTEIHNFSVNLLITYLIFQSIAGDDLNVQ